MWTLLLLAQSTPAHFLYACFLSTSLSFTTYIFFFTPISLIKVQIRWSSLTQTSVLSFVTLFTTFLPRVFRGIFWYISHLFVVSNVDSIFYANICKFAYSIESETAKLKLHSGSFLSFQKVFNTQGIHNAPPWYLPPLLCRVLNTRISLIRGEVASLRWKRSRYLEMSTISSTVRMKYGIVRFGIKLHARLMVVFDRVDT